MVDNIILFDSLFVVCSPRILIILFYTSVVHNQFYTRSISNSETTNVPRSNIVNKTGSNYYWHLFTQCFNCFAENESFQVCEKIRGKKGIVSVSSFFFLSLCILSALSKEPYCLIQLECESVFFCYWFLIQVTMVYFRSYCAH